MWPSGSARSRCSDDVFRTWVSLSRFVLLSYTLPLSSGSNLVLAPPEADPETRICIEISYFGSDFRKRWEGSGGGGQSQEREGNLKAALSSTLSWGQQELSPTGVLWEVVRTCSRIISLEERDRLSHRSWVLGRSQGVQRLAHPGYLHVGPQASGSPRSPQKEGQTANTWILDFWSPELRKKKFLTFSATQFVVLGYSSPRRPRHPVLDQDTAIFEELLSPLFPTTIRHSFSYQTVPEYRLSCRPSLKIL